MTDTPKEHRLELPSNTKYIHQVEDFFQTVNKSYGLPEDKFYSLLVAVTEAVNNGIIHGNENDESKKVTITCTKTDGAITIRVRDEGEGFTPGDIADPLQEENLLRTGGRGVFLMKSFMRSVSYNEQGNEVTMVMDIG